jgi:DNA-binding XRE family transcriptional regulator
MNFIVDLDELGRRIRKLRLERRMTLKQVEHAAGLSATHLSEIERGRTSPTIGALVRIARALDKETSYFIERDERPDVAHVTREDVPSTSPMKGVTVERLTPGVPGSGVFAYRVLLDPSSELSLKPQDLPGDALYLVRSGDLETRFGDTELSLAAGDATQASLTLPHVLRSPRGSGAEFLAVLTHALDDVIGA